MRAGTNARWVLQGSRAKIRIQLREQLGISHPLDYPPRESRYRRAIEQRLVQEGLDCRDVLRDGGCAQPAYGRELFLVRNESRGMRPPIRLRQQA